MSFEFLCEACGAKLRIADDLAGKTVKCPNCSAVVPAKAAEEPASAASPFAAAASPFADDGNPYASPATFPETGVGTPSPGGASAISPVVLLALSQTRPWVIFLSILGFLGGGAMALMSVGVLIGGAVAAEPGMFVLAPIYILYAALYLAGSYYLLLYGLKIGSLQRTNSLGDLEAALVAQKSFWKLLGIVTVVGFILGVLAMVGFLVFAMTAGASF